MAFLEGMVGLILLALLISYLPTMYSSFSRREAQVALLAVRAGSPPTGVDLVQRLWTIGLTDGLNELWTGWEQWFAELDETHTSAPSLVFFRSPRPERSWVTAAGAVLDGASIFLSSVRVEDPVPEAALCIRSGYLALREHRRLLQASRTTPPRPTATRSRSTAPSSRAPTSSWPRPACR